MWTEPDWVSCQMGLKPPSVSSDPAPGSCENTQRSPHRLSQTALSSLLLFHDCTLLVRERNEGEGKRRHPFYSLWTHAGPEGCREPPGDTGPLLWACPLSGTTVQEGQFRRFSMCQTGSWPWMSAICIFPQTQLNYTCPHDTDTFRADGCASPTCGGGSPRLPKFSFQTDCLPTQPPVWWCGLQF